MVCQTHCSKSLSKLLFVRDIFIVTFVVFIAAGRVVVSHNGERRILTDADVAMACRAQRGLSAREEVPGGDLSLLEFLPPDRVLAPNAAMISIIDRACTFQQIHSPHNGLGLSAMDVMADMRQREVEVRQ